MKLITLQTYTKTCREIDEASQEITEFYSEEA